MATKAFKRMQSSPQVLRGDRQTDKNSLFRDSADDSAIMRQSTLNRLGSSSSSSTSLLSVTEEQNASLIKKISLSGPEIRRMVAMRAAMAANLRSKNREVFHSHSSSPIFHDKKISNCRLPR